MLVDWLTLAAGLALLVGGGEVLVRGAVAMARDLGVPPLVVGLTVVAFGTSAPELAVSVTAALRGNGAVAFGNVIGSNLANIGLILAATAVLRTLMLQSVVLTREMPMMLLAGGAAVVMGFDQLRLQPVSQFDRPEGLVFLLFFGVFLYYTIVETFRKRGTDPLVEQARERGDSAALRTLGASGGLVLIGLLGLGLGGRLTVTGAVEVATGLGAPRGLIGLTVVAVGTSLPELTASVSAALKGETDLAVGNLVGSNIFNILFVLGLTSTIRAVPVPPGAHLDLVVMVCFATILLVVSTTRRRISRAEGLALLVMYLGYMGFRTVAGFGGMGGPA